MIIKSNKHLFSVFVIAALFGLCCFFADKLQVAGALWLAIICLLPSIVVALGTSYLGLKIFCATTLITQIVNVTIFYYFEDSYKFGVYRPFGFTAIEALPVFLIVGLFLLLVSCFVKISERLLGPPVHLTDSGTRVHQTFLSNGKPKSKPITVLIIILLIVFSLPIKFWMFDMGIGLTGIQPPELPFRLSGVLFYMFNYVVPLFLSFLYIKADSKSVFLALIVSVYGFLIGATSISRGSMLLIISPVIIFAWINRRWLILTFGLLFSSFGVFIITASREIVFVGDGLALGAFTFFGIFGTIDRTLDRIDWSSSTLRLTSAVFERVEGFQGLLMSSYFNPDAVGGPWGIFVAAVSNSFSDLGHDAMHLEFLGYTVPSGIYNVPATLNSMMLMASSKYLLMIFPFALYTSLTLVFLERMALSTARRFRLKYSILQFILFYMTISFSLAPGSPVFINQLFLLIFFGLFPFSYHLNK